MRRTAREKEKEGKEEKEQKKKRACEQERERECEGGPHIHSLPKTHTPLQTHMVMVVMSTTPGASNAAIIFYKRLASKLSHPVHTQLFKPVSNRFPVKRLETCS